MTSPNSSRDQRVVFRPHRASYLPCYFPLICLLTVTVPGKELGGGEIHETTNRSSEMPSQAPAVLEQPVISNLITDSLAGD